MTATGARTYYLIRRAPDEGLTRTVPGNRLFHDMRNSVTDGTDIPTGTLELLSRRLPPSWRIVGRGSGGAITLRAPDGSTGRMTVVNRRRLDPRDVLVLEGLVGRNLDGQLVVAPFLSARARELLRDSGASYADATGNVRIALPKPGLFIEAEGARKDPAREKRSLASLKGPAAGRVMRTGLYLRDLAVT